MQTGYAIHTHKHIKDLSPREIGKTEALHLIGLEISVAKIFLTTEKDILRQPHLAYQQVCHLQMHAWSAFLAPDSLNEICKTGIA